MENTIDEQPRLEPTDDAVTTDPAYAKPAAVLVIPRVVFNYVIIAIVFFALGAAVTALGYTALFNANSAENKALIDNAIKSVAQAGGADTAADQPQLVQGDRYDVGVDDDPSIGPADALVTIIEFSDFRCPYCGRFERETRPQILQNFEGRIRYVYRDFPILGLSSFESALAAQCANEQGSFWPFHDLLFANQQNLTRDAYLSYAAQLELDVATFTTCYDQQKYRDEIVADYTVAQNLGVTGTPAFFVNGRFISGAQPYQVFADIINAELSSSEESTPEASQS